jgi:hypothetical protein
MEEKSIYEYQSLSSMKRRHSIPRVRESYPVTFIYIYMSLLQYLKGIYRELFKGTLNWVFSLVIIIIEKLMKFQYHVIIVLKLILILHKILIYQDGESN